MAGRALDRRQFLQAGLALLAAPWGAGRAAAAPDADAAPGPFRPNDASLATHRTPDWFRNAKFGISAQWTPQSFPEQGDWYARNMYIQGSAQYEYHLAHFGHPSRFGYKDICHRWRGAAWDPEALVARYRAAGARYLVALANHHDGFDCWASRHQPWNSVNLGPRRDIIGGWARAARRQGLRFGAAVFATQNWQWFNVSHGSDGTGPLAGVPYDGNLTRADGRGQWWDGYDPRQLYGPPHADAAPPPPAYVRNFLLRTRDLIDRYQPDQVFFTDNGLPLGDTGRRLAAHFFNASARRHGGRDTAVINTKHVPDGLRHALTWDRLPPDQALPFPWQMDICIGDWHYKRGLAYRTLDDVVPYLVDVVSKNGNLLLNLPLRADGSLDDRELAMLDRLGRWMAVNGEALFDTRPWGVCGEGPTRAPARDFPYVHVRYTAQDIRFTRKGDTLYAIALGWPRDDRLTIRALGSAAPAIARVELLGWPHPLAWSRQPHGLVIDLPPQPPTAYAHAFRLRFAAPL